MWDQRYSEPGFVYGTEPNAFLVEVAEQIPAGPVLCLAEGEGRNAVYLASRGHAVHAVDSSAVGMRKAQQLASERHLSLETTVADLDQFEIGCERWAGIVSIFCHVPPALRAKVHRAVVEGLRPGGVFVFESYAPAQLEHNTGGPRNAELLCDLETVANELKGLRLLHARELVREVVEGRYHTGPGAVVQVVATKV